MSQVSLRTLFGVLGLLIGSGCWLALSRARPPIVAAVALVASSFVWLRVDQRMEGPILLNLGAKHGLTASDLLVPAVALAALVVRRFRSRRFLPSQHT
jgi:hypothetical protein